MSATEQSFRDVPTWSFLQAGSDQCPTCEQLIPPDKIVQVRGRFVAHDAQLQQSVTESLTAKFQRDNETLRDEQQQQIARLSREADEKLKGAQTLAEAREASIRVDLDNEKERAIAQALVNQSRQSAIAIEELTSQINAAKALEHEHSNLIAQRDAALKEAQNALATTESRTRALVLQEQGVITEARLQEQALAHQESLRLAGTERSTLEGTISKLNADLTSAYSEVDQKVAARTQEIASREESAKVALARKTDELERSAAESRALSDTLTQLRSDQDQKIAQAIQETRTSLEKDKVDSMNTMAAQYLKERQSLQTDVADLKRKLEQKSADELGEGAELDLFEQLKAEFPSDLITRVRKGTQGADIIHDIRQEGVICGKVVYDSKNRKDWKFEYTAKLRADQLSEKADHAVLSSNKFPANARQLHIHDHVVIACPARVLAVAKILRESVVTLHMSRVSNDAREGKVEALYKFITSSACEQHFAALDTHVTALERIDEDEMKRHQSVWEKRGGTLKALERANGSFRFEIMRILGTANQADESLGAV